MLNPRALAHNKGTTSPKRVLYLSVLAGQITDIHIIQQLFF